MPFSLDTPPPDRVDALLRELWDTLENCTQCPGNPWRVPALATCCGEHAAARIVVLRSASRRTRTLEFHTDARSPKISQLETHPNLGWLFYDPQLQMQLRIQAKATLHRHDAIAAAAWKRVPPSSYLNYLAATPPGMALGSNPTPLNPAPLPHPAFAVVRTVAEHLDWLWLHPQGHRRAHFRWQSHRWIGEWIQP